MILTVVSFQCSTRFADFSALCNTTSFPDHDANAWMVNEKNQIQYIGAARSQSAPLLNLLVKTELISFAL